MKIGVYVGSFNPVHKGHIKIVNHLLNGYLDKIIIMPTESYWDKVDLVCIKDRVNMLKLYKNNRVIVEEENNDLPYTYLVMEYLKKKYKNNEFYLIIGADNIIDFDKWEKYKELLKYNMVIVERDNIDIKYYLTSLGKKDKYLLIEKMEGMDISSTMIRNMIKAKEYLKLENLLDKPVLNYIIENNLYKD